MSASVCVVLLAASAAAPSLAGATEKLGEQRAAQLVQAYAALQRGDARQAVALYDRLVNSRELPPELLARALLNRGLAHQRLDLHDAAITDYDAALRIDALSARARVTALYNRALAFRARGDAGRAMEDLTAALYMDPAFAPAYFARGNILHERGLYYLALADYDQALANGHPAAHRVHYARALLFSALNNLPRTQEALYAALKAKPDFAPARQRLAAILKGRLPKTRLFADLVKRRPAKRITARITPVAGSAATRTNVRTAAVMIVGAPVLNIRKAPQHAPVAPPSAATRAIAAAPANATDGRRRAAAQQPRHPWRVAATQPLPPVPAAKASGRERREERPRSTAAQGRDTTASRKVAMLHTASIAAAPRKAAEAARAADDATSRREKAAAPAMRGWAIQLASQRSEEAAQAHWNRIRAKVRRGTRAGRMAIMRAELPGRGVFYRLRLVGFDDRRAARGICRGLKRRGISCLVVRAGG